MGETEKVYRLATALLNPRTAPALELIDCYHERWEVEVVLDEIKTHQRLQQPVLRSALLLMECGRRSTPSCWPIMRCVPGCISFTDAIFVLTETTRDLAQVEACEQEALLQEMCERLTAVLLPEHRLRVNPRVRKQALPQVQAQATQRTCSSSFRSQESVS